MSRAPLHPRAFRVTVVWTLFLLVLGSVVHATESSLACPDWPTCFGTFAPEMTGGVFWEHLHRLVASGLGLMFGLATWLAWRETSDRPWIFKACVAGMVLIVVQGIFGGLTVIYRLPDLVSTTHWTLALAFLVLATVLSAASASAPWSGRIDVALGRWSAAVAGLVFVQSILGAFVRHSDAGLACVDFPLCLGQVVPPLVNTPITVHFLHRALALIVTAAVISLAVWARRTGQSGEVTRWLAAAVVLVLVQAGLGVASVMSFLAVVPVSLHSLGAALLVTVLSYVAARASFATHPTKAPRGAQPRGAPVS